MSSLYEQVGAELCGASDPSWSLLVEAVPELALLDKTPQDPRHHAEGDVGLHTRMVLAELRDSPGWIALDAKSKAKLAWACLLHDISKPERTRHEDDGSISSKGHSGAGEVVSRALLWKAGASVSEREAICRIIKWHQIPFFAGLREDEWTIKKLSLSLDLRELSICARADALGRRTNPAGEREKTIGSIDCFDVLAQEYGVWGKVLTCAGRLERGLWIAKGGQIDPSYDWPNKKQRAQLAVFCGLPGSGKSTIAQSLGIPLTGLDMARAKLGALHGEDEGRARALAFDEVKKWLAAGSSVAFDATNLVADQRSRLESMANDYQADAVFIHVEPPTWGEWLRRDRERGAKSLPKQALMGMLGKWGAPVGEEGSGQCYFAGGKAPEPVWGAMDASQWSIFGHEALACAKSPGGKPKVPK